MTARTPRTMTAEDERVMRKQYGAIWGWPGTRIFAELDAERLVSQKLVEALEPFEKTYTDFREEWDAENEWEINPELDLALDVQAKHWKQLRAALAQYTAPNALASSEDPGKDTSPSLGGRD